MWIFVENGTQRILAAGSGEPSPANHDLTMGFLVAIPEQDLGLYGETADGTPLLRDRFYPRDVTLFTEAELAARVDRDTDAAIGAAVHPVAPVGEQIGILRDQLVQLLNTLGIEATPDFARLNEIAIAEIEKARAAKVSPIAP